jgi:hypothetical protein
LAAEINRSKDTYCDYSFDTSPRRGSHPASFIKQDDEALASIFESCGCLEISRKGQTDLIRSVVCFGRDSGSSTDHELDFHQLVCSILDVESDGIEKAAERYFSNMRKWFPVVDENDFLSTTPGPQGRTLGCPGNHESLRLLAIRLITQSRCSARLHDPESNSLHLTARRLFFIFQEASPTVALLQSGLLIAAYEWGHGITRLSYLTLSACVGLAQIMGYNRDIATSLDSIRGDILDPAVRCWSAVVVLDR